MICGLFLMVGFAIIGIAALFFGNFKYVLIAFLAICLGAFLYYDLPKVVRLKEPIVIEVGK